MDLVYIVFVIFFTKKKKSCKIIYMALSQKKTTLVHHITYMGIMAAVNLVFIVLATYVPLMMLLLILLLPFASAVVSYYCLKRYYPIYAVASIGLCLIFNISDTIFYVVPAVISGFVIGFLLKKKIHPFWMILSTTMINAVLTYAFIPLINAISGTDFVLTLVAIFKLQDFTYRNELVYIFIFIISLMQCFLKHFVLLSDVKKIGIEINTRIDSFAPYIIGFEIFMLASIGFAFFFLPLALVFVCVSLCFTLVLLADILASKKLFIYIILGIATFVGLLLFAMFYPKIPKRYSPVLFLIFPLLICVVNFVNNYLAKKSTNN